MSNGDTRGSNGCAVARERPQTFCGRVMGGRLISSEAQAEDCKGEYEQVAYAFEQLIGQHLDPVLAKVVLENGWLPDAKWQLSRKSASAQKK